MEQPGASAGRRARARRAALVALALLGTLAAASFPYLYGLAARPPGTLFWAVPPVNYSDAGQYLAFTRIARDGQILIGDPFTSEPHAPRLLMPQVLAQGLLCRAAGWGVLESFHASRVLAGLLLLLAGWWFGCLLLRRPLARWLYLGLLCCSAGGGWFVERLGLGWPNGDFLQPEGNTFFTLGNLPNLAFSSALLTALFAALLQYERRPRPGWLGLTAFLSLCLSWTHPFDFLPLGLALTAYFGLRWAGQGSAPRASLLHAGAAAAGAAPAALYLSWLVRSDPVYAALASDALTVQDWRYYAVAHAPLVLPALLLLGRPRMCMRLALPLCWVACAFLFLLTPFRLGGKQPRVVGGVHVPLAVLAAAGLESLAAARRRKHALSLPAPVGAAVGAGYLLLTATGAWGMAERHTRSYAALGPEYYLSPGIRELFRRLERDGDAGQVTLGGPFTGGWAPVLADTRSYHGHWHMTLNERAKREERNWFFLSPAPPAQKSAWLRLRGITWVIWYPGEWRHRAVPLEGVPGLRRVHAAPEAWLYRFRPGEGE